MKMHLAWIRVTAAAATTIATFGGQVAVAQSQFGPYANAPQYSTQYSNIAPYGVQPGQPAGYPATPNPTSTAYPATAYPAATQDRYSTAPAQQPTYTTAQQPAYVPTTQQQVVPPVQSAQARPQYQPPQYQQSAQQLPPAQVQNSQYYATQYPAVASRPTYPAVAQHTNHAAAQHAEHLPTPEPAMSNDPASHGYNAASSYPATDGTAGYFASDPGYGNPGYGTSGYGGAACGCEDTGVDGYFGGDGGGRHWFGGVYGLYMTRTQGPYRNYTAGVDTSVTGTPYYPAPSDIENYSDCAFLVPHWRGGVEARLGCTFGIGDGCDYGDCGTGNPCGGNACGCDPCCQPCCQQMYAWEVAWWGLEGDVQQQFVDGPLGGGDFRYYGLVNYAGLEYDDGGGAQPVNDFYNYQMPITGLGTETVLAQRVRTNFTAQNIELNILRLPLFSGGCGYDCCAPAFSLTGLCGVRYFRFDDDLEFGTEWETATQSTFDGWGNGTNELFHDIQMENQLIGFQLGANMNYAIAARWNAFWDTNFGIYNNHINQYQRMYNPLLGPATFEQDGSDATVNSSKDDVAFLGEMRLGGGYMFTPRWRGILAYRAIAVSGVALAPDQIKPDYSNWSETARINADGSLIVHGIQAGLECNY